MKKVVSDVRTSKNSGTEVCYVDDSQEALDGEVLEAERSGVVINQTFYINDVNIYVSHTEIGKGDVDEGDDDDQLPF